MKREIGFALVLLCGCPAEETTPETMTTAGEATSTGATTEESSAESTPPMTTATSGMTSTGSDSTGPVDTDPTSGGSESTSSASDASSSSTSSASDDDGGTTTSTSGVLDDGSGVGDGSGESGGAQVHISGVVRAGVAPGDDGIGTVYIGVRPAFDCFDGTTQYNDVIAAADLSVIGNEVAFSITADLIELSDDEALQVFLDDDLNAADDNDPDPNDMIIAPTGTRRSPRDASRWGTWTTT